MRKLRIIFLTLSILILCGCNKIDKSKKNEKLNVLFLIADDLNCDLGSYNHPKVISPNIDKLGAAGILFENGICATLTQTSGTDGSVTLTITGA